MDYPAGPSQLRKDVHGPWGRIEPPVIALSSTLTLLPSTSGNLHYDHDHRLPASMSSRRSRPRIIHLNCFFDGGHLRGSDFFNIEMDENASTYALQQELFRVQPQLEQISLVVGLGHEVYRARDQHDNFANKKVFQDHPDHSDVMRWSSAVCRCKNILTASGAQLKTIFRGSDDSHLHILIRESHCERSPSTWF